MLDLDVALAVAAAPMIERIELLAHEGTVEGMMRIKRAQVEVADELFAENVPAPEIQALLTHINRDIHRRIVALAHAASAAASGSASGQSTTS